jgi:CRP-like cAMP-binding protein
MKEKKLSLLRQTLTKRFKTLGDLNTIHELLSQTPLNDNFFKLILSTGKSEEFLLQICRGLKYKFYPKGQLVFEEGDTNTDYLYFIIQGQVGVYIKSIFQIACENSHNTQNAVNSNKNNSKNALPQNQVISEQSKHDSKVVSKIETPVSRLNSVRSRKSIFKNNESNFGLHSLVEKQAASKKPEDQVRRFSFGPSENIDESLTRAKNLPQIQNTDSRRSSVYLHLMDYGESGDFINTIAQNKKGEHKRESLFLTLDFFKNNKVQNIFAPKNKEEVAKLKIFEECFLNDHTKLDEDGCEEIIMKYGNKIRELNNWAIFGELSQEISRPRTASIVALINTEIIRIKQTDYQNIIKGALKTKKSKMSSFLIETLCLSKKSEETKFVYSLLPVLDKIRIKKGEYIAIQGDKVDKFYMIKSGEFRLSKIIHKEQRNRILKDKVAYKNQEAMESLIGQTISIGICGKKEYLGEEYLFEEDESFQYNIECISATATLFIFKSHVLNTFPSRFKEVWRVLYKEKKEFRTYQYQRNLNLMLSSSKSHKVQLLKSKSLGKPNFADPEEEIKNPKLRNKLCNLRRQESISRGIEEYFKRYRSLINKNGTKNNLISQVEDQKSHMQEIAEMSVHVSNSGVRKSLLHSRSMLTTTRTDNIRMKQSSFVNKSQTCTSNFFQKKPSLLQSQICKAHIEEAITRTLIKKL